MGTIFYNNNECDAISSLSQFLNLTINESCLQKISTHERKIVKVAPKKNTATKTRILRRRAGQAKFQDSRNSSQDHYVRSSERRDGVRKRSEDAIEDDNKSRKNKNQ